MVLQATEKEHDANGHLLRPVHLKLQHMLDGDDQDAHITEQIDDANAEIELYAS